MIKGHITPKKQDSTYKHYSDVYIHIYCVQEGSHSAKQAIRTLKVPNKNKLFSWTDCSRVYRRFFAIVFAFPPGDAPGQPFRSDMIYTKRSHG